MAQDLSVSLKINSDSSVARSDVQQLGQAMEELGAASKTAEKALENEAAALQALQTDLERSASEAAKLAAQQDELGHGQAAPENMPNAGSQEASNKGTSGSSGARSDVQQLSQAMDELSTASKTAEKALENETAALKPLQADLARSASEADKLAATKKLLDDQAEAVNRLGATLSAGEHNAQKLASAHTTLNSALASGTITQERHGALLAQATQRWGAHNEAVNRGGISAGQTAQAMRQLPAQITDITTSLLGGMPALMVLTQQGGQIMDSFGGMSQMFGVLRGALTLTRVAVGGVVTGVAALAMAYYEGSKEGDAYTKSLVMSGNAAGTTTNQLAQMAAHVDKVVGTQAQAAAALAKLAATGMDAGNFEQFATVALEAERSIGQSVDETVKNFDELGKAPLKATLKLNEALHYLTASVYEQIKALEKEHKTEEAGELAQQAYARAIESRTKQMESGLGSIERGWRSITEAVKEAKDWTLSFGRDDTLENKLGKAREHLRLLQTASSGIYGQGITSGGDEKKIEAAQLVVDSLQEQMRVDKRVAEGQREATKAIDDRVEAEKENTQWTEAALTPLQKMNKALKEYRENNEKITAGGGTLKPNDVARQEDEIRKSFGRGDFQSASAQAEVSIAQIKANLSLLQGTIKSGDAIVMQALKDGNVTLEGAYAARLAQLKTDTAAQIDVLRAERAQAARELANAKTPAEASTAQQNGIQIDAQIKLLGTSLQEATRQLGVWKTEQEKQLANITAKVRIEVSALTGKFDRSAVEAQLKAQYEGDYNAAGNLPEGEQAAARQRIDMLVQAGAAQAAFNSTLAEAQRLQGQLAVQEEATNTLATQGLISQTEADARLRYGRAAQVPQLQAIVQQLQAMRDAMPPDAAAAIDQMSASIGQLQNQTAAATPVVVDLGTKLKNTTIDGLADAAAGAMTSFSNLRSMVGSTLKQIAADILRSGVKSALKYIFTPSGDGAGSGSFWASAVSIGKSLFGFAEGGHIRGPGTGTSDSIPALVDGTTPIAVSNNEFIQPEKAVNKYGLGFMRAVQTLQFPKPQFAFGGLVQAHQQARFATGGQVSSAGGGNAAATPNVSIQFVNQGTPQRVAEQSQQLNGKDLVVRVVLADLQSGGPISQGMRSRRGG